MLENVILIIRLLLVFVCHIVLISLIWGLVFFFIIKRTHFYTEWTHEHNRKINDKVFKTLTPITNYTKRKFNVGKT